MIIAHLLVGRSSTLPLMVASPSRCITILVPTSGRPPRCRDDLLICCLLGIACGAHGTEHDCFHGWRKAQLTRESIRRLGLLSPPPPGSTTSTWWKRRGRRHEKRRPHVLERHSAAWPVLPPPEAPETLIYAHVRALRARGSDRCRGPESVDEPLLPRLMPPE